MHNKLNELTILDYKEFCWVHCLRGKKTQPVRDADSLSLSLSLRRTMLQNNELSRGKKRQNEREREFSVVSTLAEAVSCGIRSERIKKNSKLWNFLSGWNDGLKIYTI